MNKVQRKLFDEKTSIGVWLDDGETWTDRYGLIVCLNENDEEHKPVIDCDTKLRRSEGKFLTIEIDSISKEDLEYLFDKYGFILSADDTEDDTEED